ncbi:GntR family transcriptional regulator [Pseudaestuariivita rosea]|uniref:GntR family transcriptional regulator n=1 Tax=Pseudaestuariivita rosea TaxID=2763263 RepID=UPI001ABB25A8|nr:GntR family transcriptional regulator [Pseudaestuariivita rosea]
MAAHPKQPLRTSNDVYRLLHDDIVEGRRKPGKRLRESDLADEVGPSRTPMR